MKNDLIVIGGGPGGYVAAIRACQLGLQTVLVEKENVGGICLNHGCIPSKAIIHAADTFQQMSTASKIGIKAENVTVDFSKVMAWKARVVKKLTMGIKQLVEGNGGQIITGTATFVDSNHLQVETEDGTVDLEAEKIIIATGASNIELPFLPFDQKTIVSSKEALSFEEIPPRMVVIGGGVIGLELGQAYAKFGTQVTVIEALDSLLPNLPSHLVEPLIKKLRRLKVAVYTGAKATGAEIQDGIATLNFTDADGNENSVDAEKVLVTVGLRPNSQGFGLENTEVKLGDNGFIQIDAGCRTHDPSILAIGDVTGPPLLAHKASVQGLVAAEVAANKDATFETSTIPMVVYTDPEIASVGLTEEQAKELGRKVLTGTYSFAGHGRAATMDQLDGFVKVIVDEQDHTLVGVQVVGALAGELIGEGVLALEHMLRVEDLGSTIHPHPTLSEAISEAAESAIGRAVHILPGK